MLLSCIFLLLYFNRCGFPAIESLSMLCLVFVDLTFRGLVFLFLFTKLIAVGSLKIFNHSNLVGVLVFLCVDELFF